MTKANLLHNVHMLEQRKFRAIPGEPWVYWSPNSVRDLFEELPNLEIVAQPAVGLQTGKNERFVRYWWEVSTKRIAFNCRTRSEALQITQKWYPYMKGGGYRRWFGNQNFVVNWQGDGKEIEAYTPKAVIRNSDYYFQQGVTYSYLTSGDFSARYLPEGCIFDVAGSSVFPTTDVEVVRILAVLNSKLAQFLLNTINPTVNFQVGDLKRLPVTLKSSGLLKNLTSRAIRLQASKICNDENTFDFICPPDWQFGMEDTIAKAKRLSELERDINAEIYSLYDIAEEDRAVIESELQGRPLPEVNDKPNTPSEEDEDEEDLPPITQKELAVRWFSYALGVVMGRFQPGRTRNEQRKGPLGRAVFHREDFAVGSLPAPDQDEFDMLVGPAECFAYVDDTGGRHLFSAEVEQKLRDLAFTDGLAVVDKGHPLDLMARIRDALVLMWGEDAYNEIMAAIDYDIETFLVRFFWKRHHIKWYKRRPVYWILQSPDNALTIYLHHEQVTGDTLYTIQTDIVRVRRNFLEQQIADLQQQAKGAEGRDRQRLNKARAEAQDALTDVNDFDRRLQRVLEMGYDPDLDDGVLINLAPLHELVPWPRRKYYEGTRMSELEATWRQLEAGEYDWAKMAMKYWPERVREKCKEDKSLAIAHGLDA